LGDVMSLEFTQEEIDRLTIEINKMTKLTKVMSNTLIKFIVKPKFIEIKKIKQHEDIIYKAYVYYDGFRVNIEFDKNFNVIDIKVVENNYCDCVCE